MISGTFFKFVMPGHDENDSFSEALQIFRSASEEHREAMRLEG
jgi:hypothetical protein